MGLCYNDLWKLLIDKKISKKILCEKTGISKSTLAKMTRDEPVSLSTILKICDSLECNIEDVVTINRKS